VFSQRWLRKKSLLGCDRSCDRCLVRAFYTAIHPVDFSGKRAPSSP
jgi:hypothetical protein